MEPQSHSERQDYMRKSSSKTLYSMRCSEACLDAGGERLKVADALDFVVGKFHAEMIFEAREEFECLQAVNPQFFVEIVAGLKFGARNLEMSGGEIQNFVGGLFDCFHV
jgi:hypothetical protein